MGADTNPFLRRAAARESIPAAKIEAVSTVPAANGPTVSSLSPLQAHYLKKTLVGLQLQEELAQLHRADALELLGPPFRSSKPLDPKQLPLLRHLLHRFVLTFPFFAKAPPNFFSDKVQLFMERLLERNILTIHDETGGLTGVSNVTGKMQRYLCMLVSSSMRVMGVEEDVVRINEQDQQRLAAIDAQQRAARSRSVSDHFEVDIVGVRRTILRGRLRTKVQDEFLVSTKIHSHEVYVGHTYRGFEEMHKLLVARFPMEDIPDMPAKDESATTIDGTLPAEETDEWTDMTATTPSMLIRERNRHTLRAFLRSLLAIPDVADSEIMRSFLMDEPTTLTSADKADMDVRKRADALRETEFKEFSDKITDRVLQLQLHLGTFKKHLMEPDGLSRMLATIRRCPHVSDLPPEYMELMNWATVSMASGLFTMFVGRDSSSSAFAQLKSVHGMMPYFMVRSILRISNPVAMMRSFLDLFLAQPFGQKSLLQRMFTGRLQDEIAEMKELAENVMSRIPDPLWWKKVAEFVAMPQDMQNLFCEQARAERSELLCVVLRSPLGGELSERQQRQLSRATAEQQKLKRERRRAQAHGLPEPEPDNEDAWLLEDLHVYYNLCVAMREKEQLIGLISDSATTDLIRDMITIFYAPLAEVYRAANIADMLGDLQIFITDLIKTVDDHESLSATRPELLVDAFVNLVQRHQQLFYNFVHQVHTKGSALFERLVQWIQLFINYVRDPREPESCGLGWINLDRCLPTDPGMYQRVIAETQEVIQQAYRVKLRREIRRRRKMAHVAATGSDNNLYEDDQFIKTMSNNFGFGSALNDEIEELGDDDEDDSASSTHSSDSEEGPEDADARVYRPQAEAKGTATRAASSNEPPRTDAIRTMLPAFRAILLPKLV